MKRIIDSALLLHAQAIDRTHEQDPLAGERWLFDRLGSSIRAGTAESDKDPLVSDQELGRLAWHRIKPSIVVLLKGEAPEDRSDRLKLGIGDQDLIDAAARVLTFGLGLSQSVATIALSLCIRSDLFR
ncbi:MAG: hypothetical protein AAF666_07695 [Pseudomonadota bacterium]